MNGTPTKEELTQINGIIQRDGKAGRLTDAARSRLRTTLRKIVHVPEDVLHTANCNDTCPTAAQVFAKPVVVWRPDITFAKSFARMGGIKCPSCLADARESVLKSSGWTDPMYVHGREQGMWLVGCNFKCDRCCKTWRSFSQELVRTLPMHVQIELPVLAWEGGQVAATEELVADVVRCWI